MISSMHQNTPITRQNADIVVDWTWGKHAVVTDFDPQHGSIFVGWIDANALNIQQTGAGVVISVPSNNQSVTLQGITLNQLGPETFQISDAGAQTKVHAMLGKGHAGDGGQHDHGNHGGGGSAPSVPTPEPAAPETPNANGGKTVVANVSGANVFGFDPAKDVIDFGFNSVHSLILTKTPSGDVAIDSPWSAAQQILVGVGFKDLSLANLGVVGNEHLRQDIGGAMSWEKGIGPRDADTVYIRSHEYGVHDVVENFDPQSMKISFLYFGTRERLSVEDTDKGLLISVQPTGQSTLLVDVKLADLSPGLVEFHFDQVHEDNLEGPFGFAQEDVSLVSRAALLTPQAPAGQGTDGHQTRTGKMPSETKAESADPDSASTPDPAPTPGSVPQPGPAPAPQPTLETAPGNPSGRVEIGWDWAKAVVMDFDPATDVIDFNHMSAGQVDVREADGDLLIEVLNNGGHTYRLKDVQAEDLQSKNLDAAQFNTVLDTSNGIIDQLTALGYTDLG